MRTLLQNLLIVLSLCVSSLMTFQCKFSREKQDSLNRIDSLSRDTAKPAYNPYKAGQGTKVYDQQREVLGNLDSLVTPQQHVPNY